jgi:hypothetical protein
MARRSDYQPMQQFIDKFPENSGNEVNGLGEESVRRASRNAIQDTHQA